jgi:vitamin B12 transporter
VFLILWIFSHFMAEESIHYTSNKDTLLLQEVEVYSLPFSKFSQGQQIKTIQKEELKSYQGLGLSEILQQKTGFFVRQYGAGMMATLSMRGTSAGHNAVFWNGLPINSPSLGQADFSILPAGSFDQVDIHFGGSAALYGTDAIGGAIHLSSKLKFEKGTNFSYRSVVGSFGRSNHQMDYLFSNKNFSIQSKIYKNDAANNFSFTNLSKIGTPKERENHARIAQWGTLHDIAWNLKKNKQISSSIWFNQTDRQIQPVMGSKPQDTQLDQNLRWVMDFYDFRDKGIWNFKSGFIQDVMIFNDSRNLTHQYFASGEFHHQPRSRFAWESKSGVRWTLIDGQLDTYQATDLRLELYHASNFTLFNKIDFSLNLRQLVFDNDFAPFTPSLGISYALFDQDKQQLTLKGAWSRSYKVPTLNDRFWNPGGNPDLIPEQSQSMELGLTHDYRKNGIRITQQLTGYGMFVDQWILWLPKGAYWSPVNIRKVRNTGLEYSLEISKEMGDWEFKSQSNYNWVNAINQINISENDRSKGNQLPYTPRHKYNISFQVVRKGWLHFVQNHWIGERFISTDNFTSMPAFGLWDMGLKKQWKWNKNISGEFGGQINNIMNKDYQVLRLRAMPGRNYQINLTINI